MRLTYSKGVPIKEALKELSLKKEYLSSGLYKKESVSRPPIIYSIGSD